MKAPREIKRWAAKARSRSGKPNGVVSWLWESPEYERKMATNKRLNRRGEVRQALRVS